MKNFNIVLGIDQSLTHSAYSVFDSGIFRNSGSILTNDLKGNERLMFIRTTLDEVIYHSNPYLVAIEGYSFGSKGRALTGLHELGGVIRLRLYELGIPFYVVAPTALKKYICGPGNGFAPKEQVQCEIFDKFNFEFEDDNEADSFGLGLIAHQLNFKKSNGSFSSELEEHQIEVLNTIWNTGMEDD